MMIYGSQTFDCSKMYVTEAFSRTLAELAAQDVRIVALTGDLAKSLQLNIFNTLVPGRLYNCGIAEQNMYGMAAGMAATGLIPFTATFAPFAALRAAEQIRTDICYQKLNVKVVGTHSGISFGQAGTTHHCTEDVAVMRSFANMTVIVPADCHEISNAVRAAATHVGPVYIRLGRFTWPQVYPSTGFDFEIGKAVVVHEGSDFTLIANGIGVFYALKAARALKETCGISVRVLDMHTVKPLDDAAVLKAAAETGHILTVEDHNVIGGLGSATADVLAEHNQRCYFRKAGVPDVYSVIGDPVDLWRHYGLDDISIMKVVETALKQGS